MTRREAAKGVPGPTFSHAVLWASCSSLLPPNAYRLTSLLLSALSLAALTAPTFRLHRGIPAPNLPPNFE